MHTRIGFVIHSGPVPSPATGEAEPGPRAEHGGVGTDSQGQGDHGHGREGLGPLSDLIRVNVRLFPASFFKGTRNSKID